MTDSSYVHKTISGQREGRSAGSFVHSRWLWAVGLILIVGVFYFAIARPIQVLPQIAPAPVFELTDHKGQPFRSFNQEGRTTFYTFVATRDKARLGQIVALLDQAWQAFENREWSDEVDVVLITVDPEHDDPAVWREAMDRLGLDEARFTSLTGSTMGVKLAVGLGFGVYYESPRESPVGLEFTYDPRMILVDGTGLIRAEYDLNHLDAQRLIRDLTLLFNEESAEGINELVYSAAHLFLCYPR